MYKDSDFNTNNEEHNWKQNELRMLILSVVNPELGISNLLVINLSILLPSRTTTTINRHWI